MPDVNGCAKGQEFWVELKEIHSGNALTLRPMQVAWIAKRAQYGGQVFVLARKNEVIKLFHVDGLLGAKELIDEGLKRRLWLSLFLLTIGRLSLLLYYRRFLLLLYTP